MCYDIKASVETQLKRAERKGDKSAVNEIMERLIPLTDLPLHHSTGCNHPILIGLMLQLQGQHHVLSVFVNQTELKTKNAINT
ncbi:MAG: hypothetical protein WA749_01515 [Gelidibacter sp.]